MPVGSQASTATVDGTLTDLSVSMRNVMTGVARLSTWVNGQGNGLAMLTGLGYGTAANPANPDNVSDAQYALDMISYLDTVAQIYYGNATQPSKFDFDQELSQCWGGRIS